MKIRSCALFRWINCLDRIFTYSKIDKGLSFNFEVFFLLLSLPNKLFQLRFTDSQRANLKYSMRTKTSYNQLQKYLRHCTLFWHKWPVHDLVLVIPPPPLIKVASNTRPYSKRGGTTLNWREEGGQYYILQTCDQERFEARKVVFPWECFIIFATGCSSFYHEKQFFDFFPPPPPHFYCFSSTITTNSIFLLFTIHHHHRNAVVVVVVVGKQWTCGGGGDGGGGGEKTVESNLKEIKISEYFFSIIIFFQFFMEIRNSDFCHRHPNGVENFLLFWTFFGLLYGDQNF